MERLLWREEGVCELRGGGAEKLGLYLVSVPAVWHRLLS